MIRSNVTAQPNDTIQALLARCAKAIQAGASSEEGIATLTQAILQETERANWRSSRDEEWLHNAARETAGLLFNRLNHLVHHTSNADALQERIASLAEAFPDAIFFSPEMVARLYSPDALPGDPLISHGVERHCRFIRRAVSQVMRRYGGSIRHLSTDAAALQDELYSCALEEVVKALSDASARVWRMGAPEPHLFPPNRRRGWRQTLIVRVAMDPPATRLATLRSDSLLGVWDIEEAALIRTWKLPASSGANERDSWHDPYFSRDGQRVAWQSAPNRIAVVSLQDEDSRIEIYSDDEREAFLRSFGKPNIPKRILADPSQFTLTDRWGEQQTVERYQTAVYHWTCDAAGTVIATASEIERGMPQWMRDIGFQNAVYHILKRRLVDIVRKQTLGETSVQHAATQTSQEESSINVQVPIDAMSGADQVTSSSHEGEEWRSQHDMERILAVLSEVTITYKNRAIRCDLLARLKAEGKTNADIGDEIGVPRGTVDYLWNQCREQICLIFGDDFA